MLKKITYQKRRMIKYFFAFGLETMSFCWFIFGNMLVFEYREKEKTEEAGETEEEMNPY